MTIHEYAALKGDAAALAYIREQLARADRAEHEAYHDPNLSGQRWLLQEARTLRNQWGPLLVEFEARERVPA